MTASGSLLWPHPPAGAVWGRSQFAAVLVLAVVLAALDVSMPVCLVVLMFAPVVAVVGYETIGHRHMAVALGQACAR